MAPPSQAPRWRTLIVPTLLCAIGLGAHLLAPTMGLGLVGTLGGGFIATVSALLIMGMLHGRRLACPACGAALPYGPGDGRILACPACGAHLQVDHDGLSKLSEPRAPLRSEG